MKSKRLVVLGTGGTIAGRASSGSDNVGYKAGEVHVDELLSAIPGMDVRLCGRALGSEQVAQIDSKDMDWPVWLALLNACERNLADPLVDAVVVTHGTDTLEETAYFLHLALHTKALTKPIVLTCAMRPATALTPDGPQNVLDAVTVALDERSRGVLVVCAGAIHAAEHVQKVHTYRIDAFESGDAGPLGWVEEGHVRWCHSSQVAAFQSEPCPTEVVALSGMPRVEIVLNYAGAGDGVVRSLLADGTSPTLRGIVVAGTGNGTLNAAMHEALTAATAMGVEVVLASRCAQGGVVRNVPLAEKFSVYPGLSAVKARVRLMLALAA